MKDEKPLPADGRLDNVTASTLGEISRKASDSAYIGDDIDGGLRLVRLLHEAGFAIYRIAS